MSEKQKNQSAVALGHLSWLARKSFQDSEYFSQLGKKGAKQRAKNKKKLLT
jgi:phenylalanine-4-hydroxylase